MKESIVVARYGGGIGEGEKVANAQLEGAKGVLLYPDPEEVAREGQNGRDVAPYTRWLPGYINNVLVNSVSAYLLCEHVKFLHNP